MRRAKANHPTTPFLWNVRGRGLEHKKSARIKREQASLDTLGPRGQTLLAQVPKEHQVAAFAELANEARIRGRPKRTPDQVINDFLRARGLRPQGNP